MPRNTSFFSLKTYGLKKYISIKAIWLENVYLYSNRVRVPSFLPSYPIFLISDANNFLLNLQSCFSFSSSFLLEGGKVSFHCMVLCELITNIIKWGVPTFVIGVSCLTTITLICSYYSLIFPGHFFKKCGLVYTHRSL